MTYFHGTSKQFTAFDKSELGNTTGAATAYLGFCFTNRKNDAEMYAVGGFAKVLECELNVCKSAYMSVDDFFAYETGEKTEEDALELRETLMENGFDSINIGEDAEIVIVFDADDIDILN